MNSKLPCAALLLATPLSLFAAPAADDTLQPVIVTANRTTQTADSTLAAVTVITREEIQRQQAQSVQEVLRTVPGVNITNTGGLGKSTSVFIRGAESDHVLVLIDGVKIGSATTGSASYQNIPIAEIERIEVVRGPRSALYGSEAIGGVIQIFTRKGSGKPKVSGHISLGRYDTQQGGLNVSGSNGKTWYSAGVSGTHTDGFNACKPEAAAAGAGCFANEPDQDGHRDFAATLRVGRQVNEALSIEANALHNETRTEFDGSGVDGVSSKLQALSFKADYDISENWLISAQVSRSLDDSRFTKSRVFVTKANTERQLASIVSDLSITNNITLVTGIDYQNDEIESTNNFAVTERDNIGTFAQLLAQIGNQDFELALRNEDNEDFGSKTTGSFAWGWSVASYLRLNASYGTAFKAPTFNELYFPNFSNANLRPENSQTVEFGLTGTPDWGQWGLRWFKSRVQDLITFDSSFVPDNISEARIRGVELDVSTGGKSWSLSGNFTILSAENRQAGPDFGNELQRRPEYTINISFDRFFRRGRYGFSTHTVSQTFDDLGNTRELDPYTLVDLRAAFILKQGWTLEVKLGNVFDREYETAGFYNQAGRNAFVTLRYQQ